MAKLTRHPIFWVAHTLFFLICLLYTWKNFYKAFPFVELDVKMDRKSAMHEASDLALSRKWAPSSQFRQAVSFDIDSSTQNYIELEAGGPTALTRVLKEGVYTPYSWRVRHFAEGKTNETQIRFTPEGKPYGFYEKISEDDPGPALTSEQARAIAEKGAVQDWGINLQPYKLAESSHEVRRSKRVDHSFIYERENMKIGEGRYRLTLEVSGDHLSEVSRSIKVPDAFFRRYSSMRSANGTIASLALAAVALLYGILGCGFGLFVMARRHWVLWRVPLIVAGVIAGLHFFEELNKLPLEWMGYDTAISTQAFLVRTVANAVMGSLFEFVILFLPIMAAETLTRRAFPGQPQFWKVFSREALPTRGILGRVLGAYLMVGFHFAFVMWIYQIGSKHLGWWNPSELLFHPDALATYFPWLTSISNSLHAGVWEECLFRGIPLAGAALIGERYGHRRKWIAFAFVLQAVIFGAGHASYPTQPSYARVIELIVPSFTFGGAYLLFGLLPGIIMHYVYDVILFAMPLFLSSGITATVSCAIVIGVSLLPLVLVLVARLRAGAWRELPEKLINRAWSPELPPLQLVPASSAEPLPSRKLSASARKAVLTAGFTGLALWAGLAQFKYDVPGLQLGSDEAIVIARKALTDRGVKLSTDWKAMPTAEGAPDEQDLFVWQTSGAETYRNLVGTYLEPTVWKVRFARFEGDLIERAEEYQVYILGKGEVSRVRHELPEGRAGVSLSETQARAIADRVVKERLALEPPRLKEVSSNQFKLPSRLDWLFRWQDTSAPLKEGEARIGLKISGNEVASYRRYIEVPEEWSRKERSRKTLMGVVQMVCYSFLAILALIVTFVAIRRWVRHEFSLKAFGIAFGLLFALGAVSGLNEIPVVLAGFSTSQPWSNQVIRLLTRVSLMTILSAILPAIWIGSIHFKNRRGLRSFEPIWVGYAAGAVLSAVQAAVAWFARGSTPHWPAVGQAATFFPGWSGIDSAGALLSGVALLMLILNWNRAKAPLLLALGLAVGAAAAHDSVWAWLATGAASGIALLGVSWLVRRAGASILIPLIAVPFMLLKVRALGVPAYPGSIGAGLLGILMTWVVSWKWFGWLNPEVGKS